MLNSKTGGISNLINKVSLKITPFVLVFIAFGTPAFSQYPNIQYQTPQTYVTNTPISPLTPTNTGGAITPNAAYVSTIAGDGTFGAVNGLGITASFFFPEATACDAAGNIYVADYDNNLIRKITPDGFVSTFAGTVQGSSDGPAASSSFWGPTGLAFDKAGNLYVADYSNCFIRKITPAGVVSTLAGGIPAGYNDGTGSAAKFYSPTGVATDGAGNVYVADKRNYRIRKITPQGVVTTLAGNGTIASIDGRGTTASFDDPQELILDSKDNIYVADYGGNKIRKITTAGVVTTLAGNGDTSSVDGRGNTASFNRPIGITINSLGYLFVTDFDSNKIREVSPDGVVTTLQTPEGSLSRPAGPSFDNMGNLYVASNDRHIINKIQIGGYYIDKPLSPGLTFDTSTGTIRGTPTAASPPTDYLVTAHNITGANSTIVNIQVVLSAPQSQQITFPAISAQTTCSTDFSAGATSSNSTIPITYTSSDTTVATISAQGIIHITGAGTTNIVASQSGNPSYTPADPQTQTLTVTTDGSVPSVSISASVNGVYAGTPITFTATSANAGSDVNYQWQINNFNTGTNSPVFTSSALKDGDAVTCILSVKNNCVPPVISQPLQMNILQPLSIRIPNAFTPNGDGYNDIWDIPGLTAYPGCQVSVYTRYGSMVYQSKGYNKAWDGLFNGKALPSGTYYYLIDLGNKGPQLSGYVAIIR
jgi:gliding motility-associated-like protein